MTGTLIVIPFEFYLTQILTFINEMSLFNLFSPLFIRFQSIVKTETATSA